MKLVLMKKTLKQIIVEEIQDFYSDWQSADEPQMSLADRFFEKTTGLPIQQTSNIDAKLIGYVDSVAGKKLSKPIPVYENPKNLDGFDSMVRAILTKNLNFYVAQNYNVLHDDILKLLSKQGLISYAATFDYGEKLPEEFIAVVRNSKTNMFGQSTAYDEIPVYYRQIFDEANTKLPYKFVVLPTGL